MNKKLSYALIATGLMITSCGTARKAPVSELGGEWNVVSVMGDKVNVSQGAEQPYFGFDTANGRLFGTAGCNRIMGSFDPKAPDGTIDLSRIASTRMMCPDMSLENAILQACGTVTSFKVSNNGDVELCDAGGKTVITLKRRTPELSSKDLSGEWVISEVDGTKVKNDTEEGPNLMSFDLKDNRFSCRTNCNTINGNFTGSFIDITFKPGQMTRMACPDTSVEDALNRVLPTVKSFGRLADGSIGFYNATNDLVLILTRK